MTDTTTLTIGGTEVAIRRYSVPPQDFDPLTADHDQLAGYGIPLRPDDSQPMLRARWERVVPRIRRYVRPEFEVTPKHFHRARSLHPRLAGLESSDNWSGSVVAPPLGESFQMVAGEWTVPDAAAQPGGANLFSAAWVGMDGGLLDPNTGRLTSTDVLQAGTESNVANEVATVVPFFEWAPLPQVVITNFVVRTGDLMYCTICTTVEQSVTWALFALANETIGDLAVLAMEKPADIDFRGNSAEWVVEAPSEENLFGELSVLPLADFGAVYFDEGVAGTNRNTAVNVGDTSATLVVLNGQNSDQVLSEPTVENDHLIKVTRMNPYDSS